MVTTEQIISAVEGVFTFVLFFLFKNYMQKASKFVTEDVIDKKIETAISQFETKISSKLDIINFRLDDLKEDIKTLSSDLKSKD